MIGDEPLPMDSAVGPLPPGTIEVPANPSPVSPFSPGAVPVPAPSQPPAAAAPESAPDLAPAEGPALEMPALPPANPAQARASLGPMSSRPSPLDFGDEPIPARPRYRPVFVPFPGWRPNLAGSLLGVEP
jgi:hypothetical protein